MTVSSISPVAAIGRSPTFTVSSSSGTGVVAGCNATLRLSPSGADVGRGTRAARAEPDSLAGLYWLLWFHDLTSLVPVPLFANQVSYLLTAKFVYQ